MAALQISAEQLEKIKKIIKENYPNAIVWAYGSRVSGNSHEGSDLDLVVTDFGKTNGSISMLREAFSESDIPILVDIRYWNDLPVSFQNEIKKNYIVLL